MTCAFCAIAEGAEAVVVYQDPEVVAFLDRAPVRPGHVLIIPRRHVETFEQMDEPLAQHVMRVGQALARRMKAVYGVERVAFLFTGHDVPHVHAHVIPMRADTDVTSLRYARPGQALPELTDGHLRAPADQLREERDRLGAIRP